MIKKIEKYQAVSAIALISDAGSPLISDPGYGLVQNYISKKLMVTTIPGPSSIISALQLSGIPINNFLFHGFVPKNKKGISEIVLKINEFDMASVFFISGKRLLYFLREISTKGIDRKISVCKEMTKKNEFVFRGEADVIINKISSNENYLKGEFVVIIQGKENKNHNFLSFENENVIKKLLKKYSLTETVEIVHKLTNISKKKVYQKALLFKND